LLQQIDADIRTNSPALKVGILSQLQQESFEADRSERKVEIIVEEPQQRVFHIKTGIAREFGLTSESTHLLLQRSVTSVANLNQRLAEMAAYSALTGFLESEAPLLFGKVAGILASFNPKIAEEQFNRVIEIANVPDFKLGQRVDVDKLLKIRESAECRDFRGWLSSAEDITDAEIRNLSHGMRSKLGSLAGSFGGKAVRFAASTLAGLVPVAGLALGPVAGVVDSFLIDRLLPRSGIMAFVTEIYPSLFTSA
jgi:hypothetical protein